MTKTVIGNGILTWNANERRSDRYGSVSLMHDGGNSLNDTPFKKVKVNPADIETIVTLKARVLETRQSTHIGDFFRGVYPSTPNVGDVITLGTGKLFQTDDDVIGVYPSDGRPNDWMDIHALYKAHEQTVELFYEIA